MTQCFKHHGISLPQAIPVYQSGSPLVSRNSCTDGSQEVTDMPTNVHLWLVNIPLSSGLVIRSVQVGSPLTITRSPNPSATTIHGCVQQLPGTQRMQEFLLTSGLTSLKKYQRLCCYFNEQTYLSTVICLRILKYLTMGCPIDPDISQGYAFPSKTVIFSEDF